jgi:hypothetical protein
MPFKLLSQECTRTRWQGDEYAEFGASLEAWGIRTVLINVERFRPWYCKETKDYFVNRKAITGAGLKPTCVYLLLATIFYFLNSTDSIIC